MSTFDLDSFRNDVTIIHLRDLYNNELKEDWYVKDHDKEHLDELTDDSDDENEKEKIKYKNKLKLYDMNFSLHSFHLSGISLLRIGNLIEKNLDVKNFSKEMVHEPGDSKSWHPLTKDISVKEICEI